MTPPYQVHAIDALFMGNSHNTVVACGPGALGTAGLQEAGAAVHRGSAPGHTPTALAFESEVRPHCDRVVRVRAPADCPE
ncbi:hypothetical protein GCM10010251_76040 [Streptomyces aurantiogriseus]|uniref:Uncharacterized protein n=1 Tax=Streptomyces aurantiogriseus TaxID=66870 RepID=A0A918FKL6_9ACTN|nr:hypothetical protein GCM10010251_76040 [Streptomyces aurantiogriseus]